MGRLMPCFRARPERGRICTSKPCGISSRNPVGTSTRPSVGSTRPGQALVQITNAPLILDGASRADLVDDQAHGAISSQVAPPVPFSLLALMCSRSSRDSIVRLEIASYLERLPMGSCPSSRWGGESSGVLIDVASSNDRPKANPSSFRSRTT